MRRELLLAKRRSPPSCAPDFFGVAAAKSSEEKQKQKAEWVSDRFHACSFLEVRLVSSFVFDAMACFFRPKF